MHHVSRLHQTRERAHNNFQKSICILHECIMNSLVLSTFPLAQKKTKPNDTRPKRSFKKKTTTNLGWYCWWTKSCTTKDDDYPIIYRVLTIPGGAGFRPPTVFWWHFWHPNTKARTDNDCNDHHGPKELSRPHVWSPNRSHPPRHCNSRRPARARGPARDPREL